MSIDNNLKGYGECELSLRVFNDEELYKLRHTNRLLSELIERGYQATEDQITRLNHDLWLDYRNCLGME